MLSATGVIKDNEGFPTRYIEIKDACIGYDETDMQKPYVFKQAGNLERFAWNDVITKVLSEASGIVVGRPHEK